MRAASILCVAVLAGCSSSANVRIGSGGTGASPGTSVTSSSAGVRVDAGSAAGTLIAIGMLAAVWHGSEDDRYGARARLDPFAAAGSAPALDETRRVNEQDCTRPIEDWSANLRCR